MYMCLLLLFLQMVHRLEPGEMMTFNNRRMLHGRNLFKQNGGLRHLQVIAVINAHTGFHTGFQ